MSCANRNITTLKNVEFFSDEISKYRGTRKVLELNVMFSECGEFGGHKENISITTRQDEKFHLHYEKYSVNCDNIVYDKDSLFFYEEPLNILVDSCTIIMNQHQMNSISNFSHKLLGAKFQQRFSDYGYLFTLTKYEGFTGSGFCISFYGEDNELLRNYDELLDELKLPLSNIKK